MRKIKGALIYHVLVIYYYWVISKFHQVNMMLLTFSLIWNRFTEYDFDFDLFIYFMNICCQLDHILILAFNDGILPISMPL